MLPNIPLMGRALFGLSVVLSRLPELLGQTAGYARPAGATSPRYIEFLEQNSNVLYPALAALTIVLIVLGVLQAWRGQELSVEQKIQLKKEIVLELRKAGGGVSAEVVARALGMETFKTVRLLEEMLKDGLLLTYTNTQRLAMWQLKGVGQQQGGGYH
jgi:hypothetical protein